MGRIEENLGLRALIKAQDQKKLPFADSLIMNLNLLVTISLDISESLAVIADSMQQKETETSDE